MPVKNFQSVLLLRCASNREVRLKGAERVLNIPGPFTVSLDQSYVYTYGRSAVRLHSVLPYREIKSKEYPETVRLLSAGRQSLCLLADESLSFYSRAVYNRLSADFTDASAIYHLNYFPGCAGSGSGSEAGGASSGFVAVQRTDRLAVYNEQGQYQGALACQCSCADTDVLVLGEGSVLRVHVAGKPADAFSVSLPDTIVSVLVDGLFSRVYAAVVDGCVYCLSMEGHPRRRMEYHREPVRYMRLSVCGSFLYTADARRLCVWDTGSQAVVDTVELDQEIGGLGLVVEGNRIYSDGQFFI